MSQITDTQKQPNTLIDRLLYSVHVLSDFRQVTNTGERQRNVTDFVLRNIIRDAMDLQVLHNNPPGPGPQLREFDRSMLYYLDYETQYQTDEDFMEELHIEDLTEEQQEDLDTQVQQQIHNPIQFVLNKVVLTNPCLKSIHECPICYDEFPTSKMVVSSCGHSLCIDCCTKLVKQSFNRGSLCYCPLCRQNVEKLEYTFSVKEARTLKLMKEHPQFSNIQPYIKFT